MRDTLTPPSTERHRPSRARVIIGSAVAVVAVLFTGIAGLLAVVAPNDAKPELAWEIAGMAAVIGIATWVAALVLTRVSGWALYVVAAVLTLLTAIGVYGGSRADGTAVLVVSLVAFPAWVAGVLWNRPRVRRRP